jgi:putative RNA-binding protein, YhbY family
MLTGKQKRFLRSEAHHLHAIFQVGKDGVNDNQIQGISDALEAQELIKVKLLDNCSEDIHQVALELSLHTKAEIIQLIGRTIVLYRQSEKRLYKLP